MKVQYFFLNESRIIYKWAIERSNRYDRLVLTAACLVNFLGGASVAPGRRVEDSVIATHSQNAPDSHQGCKLPQYTRLLSEDTQEKIIFLDES